MAQRTKAEIKGELTKLRALHPIGPWARKTQATINELISELEGPPFDETSDEWNELPEHVREMLNHTKRWVSGELEMKEGPASGWKGLCE